MIKFLKRLAMKRSRSYGRLCPESGVDAEITVLIPGTDSPLSCCPEPLISDRDGRSAPVNVRRQRIFSLCLRLYIEKCAVKLGGTTEVNPFRPYSMPFWHAG